MATRRWGVRVQKNRLVHFKKPHLGFRTDDSAVSYTIAPPAFSITEAHDAPDPAVHPPMERRGWPTDHEKLFDRSNMLLAVGLR